MNRSTPPPVFDRTLDVLETFCAISSATGDREGLRRATELYASELDRRGWHCRLSEMAGADGRLLPVLDASVDRPPSDDASGGTSSGGILMIGHVDTVLPASPPRRTTDRLIATGAIDMKGGLAALLGALDLLAADGVAPPAGLRIAIVPDEEIVGPVSKEVVRRLGPAADALWVLEPGQPAADRDDAANGDTGETLVVGRRGLMKWTLDVEGRGAHAGNGYWQGRSALAAAAAWSVQAHALSVPGAGPTVNPGRLVAGDRDFVEDLAEHADLLFSPRQTNVVPDRARVEGEARYLAPADRDELARRLPELAEEMAGSYDVTTRFAVYEEIPPLDPSAGDGWRLAERARELAAARGWRFEIEEDRRGISFPNFLVDPSVVPILDGLGPVGAGMHTRDEYVSLQSLDRRIVLLADLLKDAARRTVS